MIGSFLSLFIPLYLNADRPRAQQHFSLLHLGYHSVYLRHLPLSPVLILKLHYVNLLGPVFVEPEGMHQHSGTTVVSSVHNILGLFAVWYYISLSRRSSH